MARRDSATARVFCTDARSDGGGGMEQGGLIGLALDLMAAAIAVIIVLGAVRLGSMQYALIAPHDAEGVPFLHVLGFVSGIAAAAALLLAAPHIAEFYPHRIFVPDSVWNIPLGTLLARHALPGADAFLGLVQGVSGAGGTARIAATLVAAVSIAAGLAVCIRSWRGRARWRAITSFAVLAVWSTLITHYAVHLVTWGVAQLGFWVFLVLLAGFQRWRHRSRRGVSHA